MVNSANASLMKASSARRSSLRSEDSVYWLASAVLFALQLIFALIMLPQLIATIGWTTLIIPLFVFALFVGITLRKRVAFLLGFIWSIVLVIHAFAIILLQFHPLQLGYLSAMLAQSWCLSRVENVQ